MSEKVLGKPAIIHSSTASYKTRLSMVAIWVAMRAVERFQNRPHFEAGQTVLDCLRLAPRLNQLQQKHFSHMLRQRSGR
jgi:hypothetical protein